MPEINGAGRNVAGVRGAQFIGFVEYGSPAKWDMAEFTGFEVFLETVEDCLLIALVWQNDADVVAQFPSVPGVENESVVKEVPVVVIGRFAMPVVPGQVKREEE